MPKFVMNRVAVFSEEIEADSVEDAHEKMRELTSRFVDSGQFTQASTELQEVKSSDE